MESLNNQYHQWEQKFCENEDMFGDTPSQSAQQAAVVFQNEGVKHILELGGGQGRDTLFFAEQGFQVTVIDYTEQGVERIREKARARGLENRVTAIRHDVRTPFPFTEGMFDACYSHMLYCMALTTEQLMHLTKEIHRVLKPGGLNIYTVRHKGDAHYGNGVHHGEDLYEVGGFIVHFFDREKIEHLASTLFDIVDVSEFEEGGLPRRLYRVTKRKI